MADWKVFEAWLEQQLTRFVPAGARLVVIEHEQIAGLQWHVAAGARWRASYAPSWSAILASRGRASASQSSTLAVVEVPRFRESAAVAGALQRSRKQAETLAIDLRIGLRVERGAACDAVALRALLQQVSVAKLLCHGYVDPVDSNVALMIAHAGALPLADSVAAGTPEGQAASVRLA
jgi:CHAT domain